MDTSKGKGHGVGLLIAMKPSSGPPPPRFGGGGSPKPPSGPPEQIGAPQRREPTPRPNPNLNPNPNPNPAPDNGGGGQGGGQGGHVGPDEVDYSSNDLCGTCEYNHGGSCAKYGFPIDDTGHCEAGYEARGGQGEMGGQEAEGSAEDGGGDMGMSV